MTSSARLLVAVLAAGAIAGGDALRPAETHKAAEAAAEIEIPEWRLDLVNGKGDDWWVKHVTAKLKNIKTALWGNGLPDVTASPAQDHQRCPALKLPATFYGAAKYSSWRRLYGEWNTGNDVTVATFEQNYLNIGFSRDVKTVSVLIRTAATGQVAARTRPFSDEQMLASFNWKAPSLNNSYSVANGTNGTWSNKEEYSDWNLAIFDCVGTLMYVVKEKNLHPMPNDILLYSRDGTLISSSQTGHPVLRYQFVDPSSGYLIATAEAPGINASINRKDIPTDVELGDVIPFGFKFEEGGYTNSSALMENEYRWVLATAVQALAIYKAEEGPQSSWTLLTVVEAFLIACIVSCVLLVGGLFFCIYRCVWPGGHHDLTHWHGRLAENKFLAQVHSSLLVDPEISKRKARAGWYGANGHGGHTL